MAQGFVRLQKKLFPEALPGHTTSMSSNFPLLQCLVLLENSDGQKHLQETTTVGST